MRARFAFPCCLCLAALAGCEPEVPKSEPSPAPAVGGGQSSAQWQAQVKALLLDGGTEADTAEALRLVEAAAQGGDPTAALWMGRSLLKEPSDRVRAAAWFILASSSRELATDAKAELEALGLTPGELSAAEKEWPALRTNFGVPSE